MFDYKFYCNKKLNNEFIDNNYKNKDIVLDVDIAKIHLSIKYYTKNEIFLIEEKLVKNNFIKKKTNKIEEKIILTSPSLNKRCRVLSEGCKMTNNNKMQQQFEVVLNYENTTINDNYFQKM